MDELRRDLVPLAERRLRRQNQNYEAALTRHSIMLRVVLTSSPYVPNKLRRIDIRMRNDTA